MLRTLKQTFLFDISKPEVEIILDFFLGAYLDLALPHGVFDEYDIVMRPIRLVMLDYLIMTFDTSSLVDMMNHFS
jgi:hypothetical protein